SRAVRPRPYTPVLAPCGRKVEPRRGAPCAGRQRARKRLLGSGQQGVALAAGPTPQGNDPLDAIPPPRGAPASRILYALGSRRSGGLRSVRSGRAQVRVFALEASKGLDNIHTIHCMSVRKLRSSIVL